jgi:hypothetical protein
MHAAGYCSPVLTSFSYALLGVLCVAAVDAQQDLDARVQATLAAARPALLAHLAAATLDRDTRPGELALVVLAAVHDGVRDEDLRPALARLAKADPDQTYDLALRLMVAEACPALPDRQAIAAHDGKRLLTHCCGDGPFQYSKAPVTWDLSNTQYGVLGLRAAKALGVPIEAGVWRRIAAEVGAQQDGFGGFGYTKFFGKGKNGNASMTAAGIAVLAICAQSLGDDDDASKQCRDRIARAWRWLDANADAIGSPKVLWSYYFHYGLERAAILCDVKALPGGVDWYAAGARMLVAEQLPGGGWRSSKDGFPGHHLDRGRGNAVPTAFAVLFLRRRFQKEVGPITPRIVALANIGAHSSAADIDACAQALVQRGRAAMPDLVKGMRSDVPGRRQAAVAALRQLAGQSFGYDAGVDADDVRNRAALRRAESWFLQTR